MYRKLQEDTLDRILEAGIREFAERGLDRAKINTIASRAGVSVGVIYKYYEDKDHFFLACVDHALQLLDQTLSDVSHTETDLRKRIRLLIGKLMDAAQTHPDYFRMYNEITSGSCRKYAAELAERIERETADAYAELLEDAEREDRVHFHGDVRQFAFFFDNLLMMLQHSFSCDYYRNRMELFCGEGIEEKTEEMADALTEFVCGGIGLK